MSRHKQVSGDSISGDLYSDTIDGSPQLRVSCPNGEVRTVKKINTGIRKGKSSNGSSMSSITDTLDTDGLAIYERVWPVEIHGHNIERLEINETPQYICCDCGMGMYVEDSLQDIAQYFFGRLLMESCE